VHIPGEELFYSHLRLLGGPAPVRRFLPDLNDRIWTGALDPGKVFDLTLPLADVAEGCRAMDERRAIKTRCCNPDPDNEPARSRSPYRPSSTIASLVRFTPGSRGSLSSPRFGPAGLVRSRDDEGVAGVVSIGRWVARMAHGLST
jgi:hypothetical protein